MATTTSNTSGTRNVDLFQQASRLIRTKWQSANQLAQEIWSIFRSDMPIVTNAPLTIDTSGNDTGPPIIIRQNSDSPFPPIAISKNGTLTPYVPSSITDGGTTDGGTSTSTTIVVDGGDPAGNTTTYPVSLYGEVAGKLGGGAYSMKCWAKAPGSSPPLATLTVRVPQIDAAETIPNGTPLPVLAFLETVSGKTKIVDAVGFVPLFFPPVS